MFLSRSQYIGLNIFADIFVFICPATFLSNLLNWIPNQPTSQIKATIFFSGFATRRTEKQRHMLRYLMSEFPLRGLKLKTAEKSSLFTTT